MKPWIRLAAWALWLASHAAIFAVAWWWRLAPLPQLYALGGGDARPWLSLALPFVASVCLVTLLHTAADRLAAALRARGRQGSGR